MSVTTATTTTPTTTAPRVAVVVGNPRPASRTHDAALLLVAELLGDVTPTTVLDLGAHGGAVLEPGGPADGWVEEVRAADLVVVASPTYKATYTGLLKAFLDRFPHQGLRDQAAVGLMLGGGTGHALAPEVSLLPLLRELGAVTPATGLFVEDSRHDDPTAYRAWVERWRPHLDAAMAAPTWVAPPSGTADGGSAGLGGADRLDGGTSRPAH